MDNNNKEFKNLQKNVGCLQFVITFWIILQIILWIL